MALPIEWLQRGIEISKSICLLHLQVPRPGARKPDEATGSGCVVSPQLLITNYHVLPSAEQAAHDRTELWFDYTDKTRNAERTLGKLLPDKFFVNDEKLDVAICAFEIVPPTGKGKGKKAYNPGHIPLRFRAQSLLVSDPRVSIIHHPLGQPKRISVAGGDVNTVHHYLRYGIDTQAGSSGAAVFNMDWQIAALHHVGVAKRELVRTNDDGTQVFKFFKFDGSEWVKGTDRAEEQMFIANQGVLIDFILQWLIATVYPTLVQPQKDLLLELLSQDESMKMYEKLETIVAPNH
jgi:V8-like Glu-specific endopeptidase